MLTRNAHAPWGPLIVLSGLLLASATFAQEPKTTSTDPAEPAVESREPAAGATESPAGPVATGEPEITPESLDPRLQSLGARIVEWRAVQQPWHPDPGLRLSRPSGWKPEWTAANLAIWRVMYRDFLERLDGLDRSDFSRADSTDLQLLESVCKRVGWELDVLRSPHRDPMFWVEQALGPVFDALALPEPLSEERMARVISRLQFVPAVLDDARTQLSEPVQPFALAAIEALAGIRDRFAELRESLQDLLPPEQRAVFNRAASGAATALEAFAAGLQRTLSSMDTRFAIGPERYGWYLAQIALVPASAGAVQVQAEQARYDTVAQLVIERQRAPDVPELPPFDSVDIQSRATGQYERELRTFVAGRALATVPNEAQAWRTAALPAWLAPLMVLGETQAAVTAIATDGSLLQLLSPAPPESGFADLGAWRDPRPLIAIEGMPGRALQQAHARAHRDPLRRVPLADGQAEGIAAYMQDMLMGYGLWDFSPATRRIVLQFQRFHAVKAEADIRLATGELDLNEATDFLAQSVPLDRDAAASLALRLARDPGRGIAALTGRLQALGLLADAARADPNGFSLQAFNDRLLANAHVPLSLLRSELLGSDGGLDRARRMTDRPATVPQ